MTSKLLSFILFADDTNIFFSHKNIPSLVEKISNELDVVSSWFTANKLTNGSPISRVENTKFLGITINQNLSWKPHIDIFHSKVIGVIGKGWQYLDTNSFYNSLFLPYMSHHNLIWASTYSSHIHPLFLLQKKAIRIITVSSSHSYQTSLRKNEYLTPLRYLKISNFMLRLPTHQEETTSIPLFLFSISSRLPQLPYSL